MTGTPAPTQQELQPDSEDGRLKPPLDVPAESFLLVREPQDDQFFVVYPDASSYVVSSDELKQLVMAYRGFGSTKNRWPAAEVVWAEQLLDYVWNFHRVRWFVAEDRFLYEKEEPGAVLIFHRPQNTGLTGRVKKMLRRLADPQSQAPAKTTQRGRKPWATT